jgi:anti-sigma B factor antagonist
LKHLRPAPKRRQQEKENNSMSLKLTTHQKGEVIIVVVSGKLTMGEGTSTLRTKIRELVASGSRRIVLNMADVSYMDSSGMGELIAAHTTVTTAGGEIKLLNLAKRVHDLLKLTKLYTVFEACEDEALAVNSFSMAKPAESQA